jgi:hypothetical protein
MCINYEKGGLNNDDERFHQFQELTTSNLTILDKTSGHHVLILIFSESTLIVLF